MAFTNNEERQILAHINSKGNPHSVTSSHIGLKTTDDLTEGKTNKYALLYTMPPELKQQLLDAGYTLPDNLSNLSVIQVFDILFKLLVSRS